MYIIDIMYIIYYNGGKEMNDMFLISATEARNNWSSVIDNAIRQKPQFIKRTRDELVLSNTDLIKYLLKPYKFSASKFVEDDGSVTLSLNNIDIVENALTEKEALIKMAKSIKEYSEDFYKDFEYWGSAPNRKEHMPFVLKAILSDTFEEIMESIECHDGEN